MATIMQQNSVFSSSWGLCFQPPLQLVVAMQLSVANGTYTEAMWAISGPRLERKKVLPPSTSSFLFCCLDENNNRTQEDGESMTWKILGP